jgi:diadenylate cyclase
MSFLTQAVSPSLPRLTFTAAIDILAVAFLIYQFLMIVRGRRAAHILTGIGILILAYLVAVWTGLELLPSLLATLAPYTAFALIVMFQSEIRRVLARIGRRRWLGFGTRLRTREAFGEILLALKPLAAAKTGALVVLERDIGLRTFVESGVLLDAQLSRDLLLSIFQPGGALHDGAVIIQGERVVAAACFLPLTTNPQLVRDLGTRHRAAIGVTEEADCVALVVSEETGRISIAAFGEIELDVTLERVDERLDNHFAGRAYRMPAPADKAGAVAGASTIDEARQANRS